MPIRVAAGAADLPWIKAILAKEGEHARRPEGSGIGNWTAAEWEYLEAQHVENQRKQQEYVVQQRQYDQRQNRWEQQKQQQVFDHQQQYYQQKTRWEQQQRHVYEQQWRNRPHQTRRDQQEQQHAYEQRRYYAGWHRHQLQQQHYVRQQQQYCQEQQRQQRPPPCEPVQAKMSRPWLLPRGKEEGLKEQVVECERQLQASPPPQHTPPSSPQPRATEEVEKESSPPLLWTEEPGWWLDRVSPETSPLSPEQQKLRQEPQAFDGGKGMGVMVEETMDDGGKGMVVMVEETMDDGGRGMVVVEEETMDDAGCGSEIQQEFQEEKGLVLAEKRVEQQQQASPPLPSSVQQQQAPGVPLQQQQQQLQGMVPPSPWPPPLWQGSELGALVARLVSFGMGWFGVCGDGREPGEEEGKRESDWKREGIGVVDNGGETWKTRGRAGTRGWPGILVVGWGQEPPGRRLTKPRRERVREKFKIINCLTAGASCSNQACIRCDVFSLVSSTLLLRCACWFCW